MCPGPARLPEWGCRTVDTARGSLNNSRMSRPEAVRRIKSYSAATGFVYQYYFYEVKKTRRGFSSGTEYTYNVSVARQPVFPVRIFVYSGAVEKWSAHAGRALSSTEEYAVAKVRLFQAFDDFETADGKLPDLVVDDSNLEALLAQLDI